MEVTRETFPAVLPHFLELLSTCDFYSFDEEMTGINVPEMKEDITFAPEQSYESKRLAASRYNLIQVGICLFHRADPPNDGSSGGVNSSQQQHYVARPFNFLLFPNWTDELAQLQTDSGRGVNADVVLSPSAIAFLRRHGMDFQRWAYKGIGVCDAEGERALRRHLAEKYPEEKGGSRAVQATTAAAGAVAADAFLTDEERAWVTAGVAEAEALVKRVADAEAARGGRTVVAREVLLPPQTSRNAREELRKHARAHLPSLVVSFRRNSSGGGGQQQAVTTSLTALPAVEAAQRADREAALRQREVVDLLGFRLIFNGLCASRKPCAGHNCFADLAFLMAALDGPLPETLAGWKARARSLFPVVLDTKYLSSRADLFPPGRFPASYLSGLFDQYGFHSPLVRVTLPVGFEAYDPVSLLGRGGPAHEAGYDALMTGTLALNLLAEAGRDLRSICGGGDLDGLANKVALYRSLYALDLTGEDEYVHGAASPAVVLDVTHEAGIKPAQIESCLAGVGANAAAAVEAGGGGVHMPVLLLYSVGEHRTLAVVHGANNCASNADALAEALNLRFPQLLRATAYVPPHRRAGAQFACPPSSAARVALRSALHR